MQEVTSVLTVSITSVNQMSEEEAVNLVKNWNKNKHRRFFEKIVNLFIKADNVRIENVQHFIMDK